MRRFFVKNILFVIAVNVLVKPVWVFFIDRNVQNLVAGGEYGTYQALLSISIIFQTVLDFGISNYNSRTVSQDPGRLRELFPAMLSARLVLILLYMFLAYAWGYGIGYRGWELSLLTGVLLIQSLNALVSFIRSNISALHRFKTDGIISVTDRLLMIVICGFLLVYPATAKAFRIEWFVATQVFCYFIAAIIGYTILRKIGKVPLRFSLDTKAILAIVKESFPYALLIFLMSIYNRADVMIMERICPDGKEQAGIWAAAFRLLDMANILGLMFATMLLPLFGRMLARKQDVQPIVKLCVNMLVPLAVMVAVAAVFYGDNIMHLLYHAGKLYNEPGNATQFATVFACLMVSFPAWCLMYVYSTLLTANGSLKILNTIAIAGVILNLSLNFWLIPQYKAVGGAIASCITQTTLALTFMVAAARTLSLPFALRWTMAHVGYIVFALLLGFAIARLMHGVNWMAQLCAYGALCVLAMFIFRFVSVGALKQLTVKPED